MPDISDKALLAKILCFPKSSCEDFSERLRQLHQLNVTRLISNGHHKVNGFHVLGKGHDSLVVKACIGNNVLVALKIRRVDSHVKDLIMEAENQKIANSIGIGAKVLGYTRDIIAMELIEGLHIEDFIRQSPPSEIIKVLRNLFEQCFKLDLIGLDHGELSRAYRHVIVSQGRPVIIDFGSSSRNRRPSNLPSIFSFLFLSNTSLSKNLLEKLNLSLPRDVAIEALREYKANPSHESFRKVLYLIGFEEWRQG